MFVLGTRLTRHESKHTLTRGGVTQSLTEAQLSGPSEAIFYFGILILCLQLIYERLCLMNIVNKLHLQFKHFQVLWPKSKHFSNLENATYRHFQRFQATVGPRILINAFFSAGFFFYFFYFFAIPTSDGDAKTISQYNFSLRLLNKSVYLLWSLTCFLCSLVCHR